MAKIVIEEFLSQLNPEIRKRIGVGYNVEITKQQTPSAGLNRALRGGFGYGRQILVW